MMIIMLYLFILVQLATADEPVVEIIDRVIVGQQLTISCPIKGILDSGHFMWTFEPRNGNKTQVICTKAMNEIDCIKSKAPNWLNSIKVNSLNVVINKVKSQHAGLYQCKYIDPNSIERHFFRVNILTPPGKPQIHTIPITLTENSVVKLICSSEGGNPKPTLKWLWKDFSNNPISQERRMNSTLIPSNITFGVTNLTSIWLPKSSEDANSISCQAQNSLATVSSNWMFLNINYPPVIYDFPTETYYGLLGGEVSIECKATSKSTAKFKWTSDKGSVIVDGSYLIINQLRSSDKGSYSCVVTNSVGTSSATLDIKVLSAPIITVQRSVTVNELDTLDIVCNAVPSSANVTWWLGDTIISTSSNLRYQVKGSKSFEIQCRASVLIKIYSGQQNVASNVQTVSVTVQHIPSKPSISANPAGIMPTGSDVTITCIASKSKPGLPKPDYSWRKQNSDWTRNGTNFLTLSSLKFEDSGMYGCKLFNKIGASEESVYDLQIEGQPILGEPKTGVPRSIFVRVGRSFKIECKFQGRPIPIIKWYKNDALVIFNRNSTGFNLENNVINDSWVVSILYVDESDITSEEYYRCLGENKYGSISQEFLITIIYPPKMISNVYILAANTTGQLPYRESVNLNCSVAASPNISLSWIRKLVNYNERIIENDSDKYVIIETKLKRVSGIESILYIRNFRNDDYGRYLCFAKNSEGQIETTFDIRKFSIPDPSHDLTVESKTWNSLILKWKSGFDGGYPQVFTVSYTNNMQKHPTQIRTAHSNVTLINLLPDVLYFVNISSSNIIGTGASTLSIKAKTAELMVDRDQIFSVSKDDRTIEFSLPSNLSDTVFCLTIEHMDIQKDLIGNWTPLKKCIKKDVKKLQISNPYDRFRVKICLINNPDVCSGTINQRLDSTAADTLVSTKLIGTVAAICTALVIVLAILLFFILIRSRRFLPVISDLKVMKRNRKSSFSKDDNSNFNVKSSTPLCPKKKPFMKEPGGCPLLSTYSCDQVHINGNPIEIINVCPPHNIYMEGLYSTLVKSSSISPFSYDLIPSGNLHQPAPDNVSSCCCHEDQQAFSMSLPASRNSKPNKIIYEVMV